MNIIKIEQRLQDPQRVLFFPADEVVAFLLPFLMGFVGRKFIAGVIVGFACFWVWKRLKGEGGTERLLAACYWFLPGQLKMFKGFPDSSIAVWKG